MPRNIDTTLAAELAKANVRPFYLCELTLKSGVQRIGSHVGPLVWNGNTFSGLGELVAVGAVSESSAVQADGTTISLNVLPSQLDIPADPVATPDPPYTPAAGESVAWSLATRFPPEEVLVTDSGEEYGNGGFTATTGSMGFTAGNPLGGNILGGAWYGFPRPLAIPSAARLTRVIPVVIESTSSPSTSRISCSSALVSDTIFGPGTNPNIGPDLKTLSDAFVNSTLQSTVPGAGGACNASMSFLGIAVYYAGSPQTTTSLLYEALSDVRIGAPVKLWFGMLSAAGAIVGSPVLVFSGLVDEPTIDVDPLGERGMPGTRIVLALESRLRDHARAGGRRYTAADQKLDYPNDSGFNFVEILNEISLKWGS